MTANSTGAQAGSGSFVERMDRNSWPLLRIVVFGSAGAGLFSHYADLPAWVTVAALVGLIVVAIAWTGRANKSERYDRSQPRPSFFTRCITSLLEFFCLVFDLVTALWLLRIFYDLRAASELRWDGAVILVVLCSITFTLRYLRSLHYRRLSGAA